jgi:hypothetical protein
VPDVNSKEENTFNGCLPSFAKSFDKSPKFVVVVKLVVVADVQKCLFRRLHVVACVEKLRKKAKIYYPPTKKAKV